MALDLRWKPVLRTPQTNERLGVGAEVPKLWRRYWGRSALEKDEHDGNGGWRGLRLAANKYGMCSIAVVAAPPSCLATVAADCDTAPIDPAIASVKARTRHVFVACF